LGVVRTGDIIELDAEARVIRVDISDDELAARMKVYVPQVAPATRGWEQLYIQHVGGADRGADLDFLEGASGSLPSRHSH
jgi:dihydroxy-acid dehydratase